MEILLLILTLHTGLTPGCVEQIDGYLTESYFDSYGEVMITNDFYFTALRASIGIPFEQIPNDEFDPEVCITFLAGFDTGNFKVGVERRIKFLSFYETLTEVYIYIDVKGTFDMSGFLK